MNLNSMYIISWFGDSEDTDLREKRKSFHEEQVKWAFSKGLNVFVFEQEYEEGEFIDGVNYMNPLNNRYFPGQARNYCLEEFYDTDEDFAIFADNDSVIDDALDDIDFIESFNKKTFEELDGLYLFAPINPIWTPFKKDIEDNEADYRAKMMFNRLPSLKGSLFFLRNIKKHNGLEIYNDQEFFVKDGQMVSGEDQDFGLQFFEKGLSCYCCKNIILKEYAISKSNSTWAKQVRSTSYHEGKELIAKKYNLRNKAKDLTGKPRYGYTNVYEKSHCPKSLEISFKENAGKEFFDFG